jgi:type VI secretion system secreted protein VgrG
MRFILQQGLTPQDLGLPNFNPGCLKGLTVDAAKSVYKRFFWDAGGFGKINSQLVATKVFDTAVNTGHRRAGVLAQQTCNALGMSPPLLEDGKLGPKSFAAINAFDPQTFTNTFADYQLAFYKGLVAAKPSQAKFLPGWTKRANWGRK